MKTQNGIKKFEFDEQNFLTEKAIRKCEKIYTFILSTYAQFGTDFSALELNSDFQKLLSESDELAAWYDNFLAGHPISLSPQSLSDALDLSETYRSDKCKTECYENGNPKSIVFCASEDGVDYARILFNDSSNLSIKEVSIYIPEGIHYNYSLIQNNPFILSVSNGKPVKENLVYDIVYLGKKLILQAYDNGSVYAQYFYENGVFAYKDELDERGEVVKRLENFPKEKYYLITDYVKGDAFIVKYPKERMMNDKEIDLADLIEKFTAKEKN